MPFEFKKLDINGMILILPKSFNDERGFFMETYKKSEFFENGIFEDFLQDNHSKSAQGVIRGLHYQLNPKAQGKLVRCTKGKIYDVGVDIRKGSPSFGKYFGAVLSDENKHMLYIPKGFAHGFVVISKEADVLYKTTEEYSSENDKSIRWNDPDLCIDWKISEPIVSEKDQCAPFFKEADINFIFEEQK